MYALYLAPLDSCHSSGNLASRLQVLGLQRCYKLDATTLTHILGAASAPASQLDVVTLSHLNLQGWPTAQISQNGVPLLLTLRQDSNTINLASE